MAEPLFSKRRETIEGENGFVKMDDAIAGRAKAHGFDFDDESRDYEREGEILEELIRQGAATSDEQTEYRMGLQLGKFKPLDSERYGGIVFGAEQARREQKFIDQYGLNPGEVEQVRDVDRSRAGSLLASTTNNFTVGNADRIAAFAGSLEIACP